MTVTHADQPTAVPGEEAEKPAEIPARGWLQIAKRGWAEAKADQVPLLAAGVAYYGFLAIFPAMIAAVLLYGFFADPAQISNQVDSLTGALPADVSTLIKAQLLTLTANPGGAGLGALVSILLALWSTSGGVGNLMSAVNTAYDEEETRSFVKKRLTALALTLGAIVFVLLMLGLVAVLPVVLAFAGTSGPVFLLTQVLRWVLIAALISVALAVLYRVAPDRAAPKLRWVSVGAAVATVLWLLASVGFSVYVSQFGNYAKTYGALAGIVVLLFWLWITSYAILLGAEMNAEAEQQTIRDTTTGAPLPLGRRDAVKADSVPDGDPGTASSDPEAHSQAHPDSPDEKDTSMSSSEPDATPARTTPDTSPESRSTGELVKAMSEDLSRLVRDEIRLAQAEVGQKAKKAGFGVGAFGGAGVFALYGLGVLIAAAVLGFANVVSPWLAALIVAALLFVVAGVAAVVGKKQLAQGAPPVPTRTIASVKTDVAEIKESIKR